MRIIVTGANSYSDKEKLFDFCDRMVNYIFDHPDIYGWLFERDIEYLIPDIPGASQVAKDWVKSRGFKLVLYPKTISFKNMVLHATEDKHGLYACLFFMGEMGDKESEGYKNFKLELIKYRFEILEVP